MSLTPTISTTRLSLRALTKPSQSNLRWLRDPEVVWRSQQRHRNHTLSTQLRYINSFSGKSHLWGIYLFDTGEHIGNVSARHDDANNVSDVGIMIGERKHWGKGLAKEAWLRVCYWLLDKDGGQIRKLEAGCAKDNVAMVKIITGSGFVQEGELLNHFLFDGHPVSMLLFGRVK